MSEDSYYRDHWIDIEDERLQRYEEMFQYHPGQDALLMPLALSPGHRVLDFGCGPGFLSMELARRVGDGGSVIGIDLNEKFIANASARAAAEGLAHLEFRRVRDTRVPMDDADVDRVICKNVLEYVPDASATLAELLRVLRPGGVLEVIDSDWGFVIVEPWGKVRVEAFFKAASGAFREPYIGRKLPALLEGSGYVDVEVNVVPFVDREGRGLPILKNMVTYIRNFDGLAQADVDAMMEELSSSFETGTYLFVLPQFIVTGRKKA